MEAAHRQLRPQRCWARRDTPRDHPSRPRRVLCIGRAVAPAGVARTPGDRRWRTVGRRQRAVEPRSGQRRFVRGAGVRSPFRDAAAHGAAPLPAGCPRAGRLSRLSRRVRRPSSTSLATTRRSSSRCRSTRRSSRSPARPADSARSQHIAEEIRDRILAATGLHASFGVATCKTVAKIASDLRKPRGFVVVDPGRRGGLSRPAAAAPAARARAGCRARVERVGNLDARAACRSATRHGAAAGRSRRRNVVVGARAGHRHGAGHRPRAHHGASRARRRSLATWRSARRCTRASASSRAMSAPAFAPEGGRHARSP